MPLRQDYFKFEKRLSRPKPKEDKGTQRSLELVARTYRISTSVFNIIWSYFPQFQSTLGVIVRFEEGGLVVVKVMMGELIEHRNLAKQRMLLAMIAQMVLMPMTEALLNIHLGDVVVATTKTGFYHHVKIHGEIEDDTSDLNYAALAAEAGGVAGNLATSIYWWQGYCDLAENIINEIERFLESRKKGRSKLRRRGGK